MQLFRAGLCRDQLGGVGSRLPSSPALSRPPGGPLHFIQELIERLVPNQAPARIQTPRSHRARAPTREPPGCWPLAGTVTSCRRRRKRVPVPFVQRVPACEFC